MSDDNITRAFEDTWRARRELARAEQAHRFAQSSLEACKAEMERAQSAVERADAQLQAMAARAAGVDMPMPDDTDVTPPRPGDGFRPTRI